jgi:hypothetical protein
MKSTVRVTFDDVSIRLLKKRLFRKVEEEVWSLTWADVERIGYRTTSGGPWWDYFLVFRKKGDPPIYYQVPVECPGAHELAEYVDRMPGTKFSKEGKLANCIEEKSVTIWPAENSGEPI